MAVYVSIDEAQVLTRIGFYEIWLETIVTGVTHEKAYDHVEKLHQQINKRGKRMYSDFRSFYRQTFKIKKELAEG
ncbi:hypothetical protein [Spirosoma daeguense]